MLPGVLCGLLAGAMWGTVFMAPQVLDSFSPVLLAVGRYVAYGSIAMVLLLPDLKTLASKLDAHDCLVLARQACTGSLAYYILLALGVEYAGVAPTSVIIGLLPLTITWLGRKDQGSLPVRSMAIPLLLMIASVAALNIEAFLAARAEGATNALMFGLLCAVGALSSWSWYAVDNARFLKSHPQFTSAQWSGLYGMACGMMALVIGIVATQCFGERSLSFSREWSPFWKFNVALALVTSVFANHLWNVASRRVPVSLSAPLGASETLFAILYGVAFGNRGFKVSELVAVCLLTVGLGVSVHAHTRRNS